MIFASSIEDTFLSHIQKTASQGLGKYHFIRGEDLESCTYQELLEISWGIAAQVAERTDPHDRILLLFPQGMAFIAAFLGTMAAGRIAVPTTPPSNRRNCARLERIIADCQPSLILSAPGLKGHRFVTEIAARFGIPVAHAHTQTRLPEPGLKFPDASQTAFLQYTSGSTGQPKGVMISHGSILANESLIQSHFKTSSSDRYFSWLPFFHDMGLIGGVLHPLFMGGEAWLMDSMDFLRRPEKWLQTISKFEINVSGGPNFSYDHCVDQIAELPSGTRLDSWRVAFNGAERVRKSTLDQFSKKFAANGFRESAWLPCYGMAETTLLVTSTDSVRQHGPHLSCGKISEGTLCIVREGKKCAELEEGEIWVSSASKAQGYWNKAEANAEIFEARLPGKTEKFLRTGDMGYLFEGELFITGRSKDLIIVRGRNIHPEDIEASLSGIEGLVPNGAAAFSLEDSGRETVAVVAEATRRDPQGLANLPAQIREKVFEALEIAPDQIVLIRKGTLPRTTSGKVRRSETRKRLRAGELYELHADVPSAPQSPAQGIRALLEARLGSRISDPNQNLYAYGLDSLRLVQVARSLSEELNIELDLSALPHPLSLNALEAYVAEQTPKSNLPESEILGPVGRASHFQESVWKSYRLVAEPSMYHIPIEVKLPASLSPEQLKQRIQVLLESAALLRTQFREAESGLQQEISADTKGFVPELQMFSKGAYEEEALRQRFFKSRFSLEAPPYWRIALVEEAAGEWKIWMVFLHLLTDGAGVQQILRAVLTGHQATNTFSYLNWAHRDRNKWTEASRQAQRTYWLDLLQGAQALELPVQPSTPASPVASLRKQIAASDWQHIQSNAAQYGTSPAVWALAAYCLVLCRWAGKQDLLVGVPVQTRTSPDEWEAIGPMLNTILVRAKITAGASYFSLVDQIQAQLIEGKGFHRFPIDEVLEALSIPASADHFPMTGAFFNALFYAEEQTSAFDSFPGMSGLASNFILNFYLATRAEQLEFRIDFRTDALEAETVGRLWDEMLRVMKAGGSPSAFPPLPSVFSPLLLDENAGEAWRRDLEKQANERVFEAGTILELLEAQVKRTPERLALVQQDRRVSYREFEAKTRQLALSLQELGIKKGQFGVLLMDKTLEVPLAFYAMMKLGVILVPMDLNWPLSRIQELIDELEGVGILYNSGGEKVFQALQGTFSHLKLDFEAVSTEPIPDLQLPEISPEDFVYGMYTSGTTGRPKCTLNIHLGLHNRFRHMDRRYGQRPDEVALFSSKYDYDAGLWQLFWPLCNGGSCILPFGHEELDFDRFCKLVDQWQVTFIDFVPTVFDVLVSFLELHPDRALELKSLRQMLIGGEYVNASSIQRFRALVPKMGITNTYGATEASMGTVFYDIPFDFSGKIPIGKPIDHVLALVLNEQMEPVRPGSVGELYLGGDCVGKGYYKAPEKTALAFPPAPFAGLELGHLYKTGDLVLQGEDGNIHYVGRRDSQIKRGGVRIELEEVEQILLQHAAVEQAAVLFFADPGHLVAYLVGEAEQETALWEYLKDRLPGPLVPDGMAWLATFPRIGIGKVDKKALRKLPYARRRLGLTDGKGTLDALAAEFLGLLERQLGLALGAAALDLNFAAVGGTSLQALELSLPLEQALGLRFSPLEILAAPSLGTLLDQIRASVQSKTSTHVFRPTEESLGDAAEIQHFLGFARCNGWRLVPAPEGGLAIAAATPELPSEITDFITPRAAAILAATHSPRPDIYPASYLQRAVWRFLLSRSNTNIAFGLVLETVPDPNRLQEALLELVRRHEALHSSFLLEAEILWQKLIPVDAAHFPLQVHAVKTMAEGEARCLEFRQHVFDLFGPPLLQSHLLMLPDQSGIAFFVMSHLISDGLSIPIFARDLLALYEGDAARLPILETQFRDDIHATAFKVELALLRDAQRYWQAVADNVPTFHAFSIEKREKATEVSYDTLKTSLVWDGSQKEELEAFCQRLGLMPSDFFMVLETLLVYVFSGMERIMLSSSVHNRELHFQQDQIGLYTNSLFQMLDLRTQAPLHELAQELVEQANLARIHNAYPHNLVFDEFFGSQGYAHHEVRKFKYNYIDLGTPHLQGLQETLQGQKIKLPEMPLGCPYQLLQVVAESDRFQLHIELNAGHFDAKGLEKFAEVLERIAQGWIRNRIEDLETLTNFISSDSNKAHDHF